MIQTENKDIWELKNVQLEDGEIKFRFNNGWTINLGKTNDGGLMQDGANIKIQKGLYDIIIDLTNDENLKYSIIKYQKN